MKIYFTSDLHFCHDREFLYKPRGFKNIEEMNETIIKNWNSVVSNDDLVYILGDLMLKDNAKGIEYINNLKGNKHIILGNHDTDSRVELYKSEIKNLQGIDYAKRLRYNGYCFFLTHYPCLTGNLEKENAKQCTISLFGHTHSKAKFYEDRPYMYNVALDAHDCTPVEITKIIKDIEEKYQECKNML